MNNNKKAINKLTLSTLKNKTKTLFMFVSIILVTFMIYSIFSIGFSYYDNYQGVNIKLTYYFVFAGSVQSGTRTVKVHI